MIDYVDKYIDYLKTVKRSSSNTIASYRRDLVKLCKYLETDNITNPEDVSDTVLNLYIMFLENNGMSTATVSRSIASIKSFFMFLKKKG